MGRDFVSKAARGGAQVICLPELFRSRYFCQTEDTKAFRLAETIPGPTTRTFARLARRERVVLIVPMFERRAAGVYHNSAVVIDADGSIAGVYRKMHVPDDPHFVEKFYFSPGDEGCLVVQTRYGRIGVLICWDQWFPEAARLCTLKGAEILFYPTAIGWKDPGAIEAYRTAWEVSQRAHAIANGVYVAATNRCGREGELEFWGHSFAADPFGKVVTCLDRKPGWLFLTSIATASSERVRNGPSSGIEGSTPMGDWISGGSNRMKNKDRRNFLIDTNYRMPAEWAKHEATWLVWPHNRQTWPGRWIVEVETLYRKMIEVLLFGESVRLFVRHETAAKRIRHLFRDHPHRDRLLIQVVRTQDSWVRDYGPIFTIRTPAKKGENCRMTKWRFDAWGGKYKSLVGDDRFLDRVALTSIPRIDAPIVLEGGSIDVNGSGLCLSTEQCLLRSRNPGLSKKLIEETLSTYLGIRKIIWLSRGISGDDTDGHIDNLARFCSDRCVLTGMTPRKNSNYAALSANLRRLKNARDLSGRKLEVIPIPMPESQLAHRFPLSYLNFYIANETILVPVYRASTDREALALIESCFPSRVVIPFDSSALVRGLGSIHCVTQQEPANVSHQKS